MRIHSTAILAWVLLCSCSSDGAAGAGPESDSGDAAPQPEATALDVVDTAPGIDVWSDAVEVEPMDSSSPNGADGSSADASGDGGLCAGCPDGSEGDDIEADADGCDVCPTREVCTEPDACPEPEECPEPTECPEPPEPVVIKSCPAVDATDDGWGVVCTADTDNQPLPVPGSHELVPGVRCLVGLVAKTVDAPRAAYVKFTAGGLFGGTCVGDQLYGQRMYPVQKMEPTEFGPNFSWSSPQMNTAYPANGWDYYSTWKKDATHVVLETSVKFKRTFEVTKPTVQSPPYPITDAHLDEGGCVAGGAFNAWLWAWPNAVALDSQDECPVTTKVAIDVQNVEAYDVDGNQLKVEYLRTSEGAFLVTSQLDW